MTPRAALRALESLRLDAGPGAAAIKVEALDRLRRARLGSARDVFRLHEAASFARTYPDDARVARTAQRVLASFGRRADLGRFAEALGDSGIAGTPIRYRFFWPMARWLASRWPAHLTIDWESGEFDERLRAALPALLTTAEAEAIRRLELPARRAIDRLRARRESDGAFLIARIAALPGGDRVREAFHDAIDVAYLLRAGADGPSRTIAELPRAPRGAGLFPPERARPDLARALTRPPRAVWELPEREGVRVVDLAREAMVTRSRDLDAFAFGDARDVRIVDDGDGLAFAVIGVTPERRLFLPAVYGALTLRNGRPIGYVQLDVLLGNAEISYNTFPTYRGAEAGFVFGRLLAAVRHVFGATSFSVEPYQLGRGNEEGIASGAWWFYALFGFRPHDRAVGALARRELARRARDPEHRSDRRMLERLAEAHVFWSASSRAPGRIAPIGAVGLAIGSRLAARAGAGRDAEASACEARARERLGVRSTRGWSRDERLWWRRWAPMIDAIPGVERWPAADRASAVRVVRAKGGRRESEFAAMFDRHRRLRAAVAALAPARRNFNS